MVKIRCRTRICFWLSCFVVLLGVQRSEESVWKQNTRWTPNASEGTKRRRQPQFSTSSHYFISAALFVSAKWCSVQCASQFTPFVDSRSSHSMFPFPQINSSLSFMFDVVSIIKFYSSAVSSPKWQLIFRSAILGVGWGGGCSLLSQNFIVVHLLSRRAT